MSLADIAPTRRALVGQAGLLATLAAIGTCATIPPADAAGLSPIERAFAEYMTLFERSEAASIALSAAEMRYEEPDPPVWSPGGSEGGYKIVHLADGRRRACLNDSDENIAALRAIIARPFKYDPTFVVTEQSHAYRVERAEKTLAAIEAWQAECRRRGDAVGLTEAQAAWKACSRADNAQIAAIRAMRPTSFRDLAFQAAFLRNEWDDEAACELVIDLMRLAGIDPWGEFQNEEAA